MASHNYWKKSYDQPRQHIKKKRHYFADKGPSSQSYGFSSSHVWMWELDYKESWELKNWYYWAMVSQKTFETARRSNQLILKEISLEYSLEGLMLKLKLQYFGHMMWGTDLLEKTLMLGDWRQDEKGMTGWDAWMASPTQWIWVWASSGSWWWDREGSLVCYIPWGCKESDTTEWLNWTYRCSDNGGIILCQE